MRKKSAGPGSPPGAAPGSSRAGASARGCHRASPPARRPCAPWRTGHSSTMGNVRPTRASTFMCTACSSSELPPTSKKLSSAPTRSNWSTSAQMAASDCSSRSPGDIGVTEPRPLRVRRRQRLAVHLAVGRERQGVQEPTMTEGTMCSGEDLLQPGPGAPRVSTRGPWTPSPRPSPGERGMGGPRRPPATYHSGHLPSP